MSGNSARRTSAARCASAITARSTQMAVAGASTRMRRLPFIARKAARATSIYRSSKACVACFRAPASGARGNWRRGTGITSWSGGRRPPSPKPNGKVGRSGCCLSTSYPCRRQGRCCTYACSTDPLARSCAPTVSWCPPGYTRILPVRLARSKNRLPGTRQPSYAGSDPDLPVAVRSVRSA